MRTQDHLCGRGQLAGDGLSLAVFGIQGLEEVQCNLEGGLSNLLGTADAGNELSNLEQVQRLVRGADGHVLGEGPGGRFMDVVAASGLPTIDPAN